MQKRHVFNAAASAHPSFGGLRCSEPSSSAVRYFKSATAKQNLQKKSFENAVQGRKQV